MHIKKPRLVAQQLIGKRHDFEAALPQNADNGPDLVAAKLNLLHIVQVWKTDPEAIQAEADRLFGGDE